MLHQIKDMGDPSTDTAQLVAEAEAQADEEAFQEEKAKSENVALLAAHDAVYTPIQPQ